MDAEAAAIARRICDALETAWAAGDADAFAAACAPDADYVNLVAMYASGREAIAAMHRAVFAGPYAGSVCRFDLQHARRLPGGLVVAHATTEVDVPAGPFAGKVLGSVSMVLAEHPEGWLIEVFQNTRRPAAG